MLAFSIVSRFAIIWHNVTCVVQLKGLLYSSIRYLNQATEIVPTKCCKKGLTMNNYSITLDM